MSVETSPSSFSTFAIGERLALRVEPAPVASPAWLRAIDRVHGASRSWASVAVDAAVLAAAATAAHLGRPDGIVVPLAVLLAFNLGRVYTPRSTLETQGVLWYPARIATPYAIVALAWALWLSPSRADAPRFVIYGVVGLVGVRVVTWALLHSLRRRGLGLHRTVVIGRGTTARYVLAKLGSHPEAGLMPVGILSPDGKEDPGQGVAAGALPSDLPAIIHGSEVSHVILVPEGDHDVAMSACLELCDGLDVSFSLLPPLSEMFIRPTLVTQVAGVPLIPMGKVTRFGRTLPGKRAFDLVAALLLLVALSPLLIITGLVVKLADGGPLLYRQLRVGHGGRTFLLLKFRSMVVGADDMADDLMHRKVTDGLLFKVLDDPRVTRVGRILRRLSLDELPQLWNVVRGQMSLVGPRPLAVAPEAFGAMDGKRHSVRPGITGYWQIAGGNGLTYAEMVKLDLAYIQNWSLWLDLRLLVRTVPALISRRGPW